MKYEEKNDQIKFNLNVYEVFFTNCVYLKKKSGIKSKDAYFRRKTLIYKVISSETKVITNKAYFQRKAFQRKNNNFCAEAKVITNAAYFEKSSFLVKKI